MSNKVWYHRHRPSTIDQFVFHSEEMRESIMQMIKDGEIASLLFSGIQGSGKTTLAYILLNELKVPEGDILKLNGSSKTSVEVVRNMIEDFVSLMPEGKFMYVLIDEADHLSTAAQASLRELIEASSDNARFIFTCNYRHRIIPALHSRFQEYSFKSPDNDEVLAMCAEILTDEGIDFGIEELEHFVAVAYPDVRKIINLMEQHSRTGILKIPNVEDGGSLDYKFALLEHIEADQWSAARALVCENVIDTEVDSLYRFFYENLRRSKKFQDIETWEKGIVLIDKYMTSQALVADLEIHLAALIIELGGL